MADLDAQIDALVKRRNTLTAQQQRLIGQYESAKQTLDGLEQECLAKGIAPDQLDLTIAKLEDRIKAMIQEFQSDVDRYSEELQPFLKGVS